MGTGVCGLCLLSPWKTGKGPSAQSFLFSLLYFSQDTRKGRLLLWCLFSPPPPSHPHAWDLTNCRLKGGVGERLLSGCCLPPPLFLTSPRGALRIVPKEAERTPARCALRITLTYVCFSPCGEGEVWYKCAPSLTRPLLLSNWAKVCTAALSQAALSRGLCCVSWPYLLWRPWLSAPHIGHG